MPALSTEGCAAEMPRYRSHKIVHALKIKAIELAPKPTIAELEAILNESEATPEDQILGATITPEEDGYSPFAVSRAYTSKHNPQVGGYYVVYADGYASWSPAQAFEEGYTRWSQPPFRRA
jgi:hypothetical protein